MTYTLCPSARKGVIIFVSKYWQILYFIYVCFLCGLQGPCRTPRTRLWAWPTSLVIPGTSSSDALGQPVTIGREGIQPLTTGKEGSQPLTIGREGGQAVTIGREWSQPLTIGREGSQPVTIGREGSYPVTIDSEGNQPVSIGSAVSL